VKFYPAIGVAHSAHRVFDVQSRSARTSGSRSKRHRDGAIPSGLAARSSGGRFAEVACVRAAQRDAADRQRRALGVGENHANAP